jgi:tetratricopeptide (TPR) repeat protein
VRTAAERVRITAQLIKAGTGYHVWSETYDRDVSDIFAVQDEISKAIVDALRLKMGGTATPVLAQQATTDPEAHELVLKGLFHSRGGPNQDIDLARSLFEQAIARDPNYAIAHAWLGSIYQRYAYRRMGSVSGNYATAERMGKRAIELDPNCAEAYMLLARIEDVYKWKFASAEKMFAKAVELNPGLAGAHEQRSWLLMRLGKPAESVASARRAVLLDPLSPSVYNTLGAMLSYSRQHEEATTSYRSAVALDPKSTPILGNLALSYEALGNRSEAEGAAKAFKNAAPDDIWAIATTAYLDARAGRRAPAEAGLKTLRAQEDYSPYLVAMVYTALGQKEEAFRELERAVETHDDYAPDLGVDDVFDPLRSDPRMAELLKRMGLAPSKPLV